MSDDDTPDSPNDDAEQQPTAEQTVSAADPVGLAEQHRRVKREQREADDFWRGVLSTPVGRREVWNLIQIGHAFEERFACGPNGFPQVEATWFHAGEQALALRIYQSLQIIDHAGVLAMLREHDPRFKSREQPRRRARKRDA